MINFFRIPFLLLAIIGLIAGLFTGLSRIGWEMKILETSLHHGAIMVGGFLGTLISLEKIIPLKKKVLFAIPLLSGLSVITLFAKTPTLAFVLLVCASASLSVVFVLYLARERNQIYVLMLAGSLCWFIGNIVLISAQFYPLAFPWWLGFILFIIAAERLELMKFLPVSQNNKYIVIFFLFLYVAGTIASFHSGGNVISGVALIGISLWLMKNDVISISIRKAGLPRFVAVALLSGYIAMLMTGIFFLALGAQPLSYDVIVHTFFLGFVFAMIFAHGPIILPGVLGISAKPYHPILYLWLILLHVSWISRVTADITLDFQLRRMTGIVSALCIIGYFATMATLTVLSQRRHAKLL